MQQKMYEMWLFKCKIYSIIITFPSTISNSYYYSELNMYVFGLKYETFFFLWKLKWYLLRLHK